MRAAFGAIGGALAVGAMLVSYNLGARSAFPGQAGMPTTQMMIGPDGVARPYLVQAGQGAFGQAMPGQAYAWSPYSTTAPGAVAPLAYAPYQAVPAYQPAPYPVQRGLTQAMKEEGAATNDYHRMQLWAGQSAALAKPIPAADLVAQMWRDAQRLLSYEQSASGE